MAATAAEVAVTAAVEAVAMVAETVVYSYF